MGTGAGHTETSLNSGAKEQHSQGLKNTPKAAIKELRSDTPMKDPAVLWPGWNPKDTDGTLAREQWFKELLTEITQNKMVIGDVYVIQISRELMDIFKETLEKWN